MALKRKPLGEILQEAALISSGQVQVALMEQLTYDNLKIGEILALHGWIEEKTVNFFADTFPQLINNPIRNKIGNYLCEAGLLNEYQVEEIITEQFKTGIKFGSLAVIKGFIKPETLDFFLRHLFPDKLPKTDLQYLDQEILNKKKQNISSQNIQFSGENIQSPTHSDKATYHQKDTYVQAITTNQNYQELAEEDLDDIPWID